MISFESDYINGAHPAILERLVDTNMEATSGYGTDGYTDSAIRKIRESIGIEDAEVYFAAGGTQANQLVISTMLKDYEGVVAATTGHVSAHEAGAIEYSGHKVLTIPGHMGKIDAVELKNFIEGFYRDGNHEHMVFPGMVYISQPTEYGSIYSLSEMIEISHICNEFDIPLFIDGARLAYGLMSEEADFSIQDIARLCDVFYIGGTKVGTLFGEAIVFTKNNMPKHFVTLAKQRGALIAKGRLLGLQFDTLFTDNLYFECGKNAIENKKLLVDVLKRNGYKFFYESPTNQQFIIIDNDELNKLRKKVAVSFWEEYSETQSVIRLATSWATTKEDIEKLDSVLDNINKEK